MDFDVDMADNQGDTCLHAAVKRVEVNKNDVALVEMLLDKG